MIITDNLPEPMRNTIDEAYRLLGPNLSAFLLSGPGETCITHHRAFAARITPDHGAEITCQLKMINDSEHGLPIGHDPFVIAVLLNLLHEEMRMDDTVDFTACDLLQSLGWSQLIESQPMVERAVERYASTTYCLIEPTISGKESKNFFQRLLIHYETVSKPLSAEEPAGQLSIKVQFFPHFIYHIYTQRKIFLGIDFQQLEKMRESPC
jgi:hypothetical protein